MRNPKNSAVFLQRISEQTLDIIFVDINMPSTDGLFYLVVVEALGQV